MNQRVNYAVASRDGYKAMLGLQSHIDNCGLEHALLELVKTRASQINACAYCIDMHTKDARAAGESEQRLYGLSAWRETPFYSARERAALAFTEAVTAIQNGVDDAVYEEARAHFSDKEIVDLTLAIVLINGWNRLSIAFRTPVGSYQPKSG